MAIRVSRNAAGNCINFIGSSQPSYWNACLSAQVNADDNTRIDVINDIQTASLGENSYEFYAIPFTEFVEKDGTAFVDATAAAAYITTNANVIGSTGSFEATATDYFDFVTDVTNTSVLVSNGDAFGVNSIKAVGTADGLITIQEINGVDLYTKIHVANVTITGSSPATTQTGVVNSLNALFSVTPLGIASLDDIPTYPIYEGAATVSSKRSGEVPSTNGIYGPTATTHAFVRSSGSDVITDAGEYFTVKIAGDGAFILGLVDITNASDIQEADINITDFAHAGLQWGLHMDDFGSYVMPATTYGTDTGTVQGVGWTGSIDQQIRYNTDLQEDFTPDRDGVEFKIGIMPDHFIGVYYLDTHRTNEYVLLGRSNYAVTSSFRLMLKMEAGSSVELLEEPIKYLRNNVDGVTLNYRYIESPDGYYSYPLFATQEEAQFYSSDNASVSNTFVDEPTNTVWHAPNVGYVSSTQDSNLYTPIVNNGGYTEIVTSADIDFVPTAFSGIDHTFAEGSTGINIQLQTGASFTQTVSGLPTGLSYANGYVQGSVGYVSADTDYTITVTRTNNFGSSTGTFNIKISNNVLLSAISDWAVHEGNTLAPNKIFHDEVAVLQYINPLKQGEQIRWTQTNGSTSANGTGGAGQYAAMGMLNSAGETAAAGGTLNTESDYSTHWDLRGIFWTDMINQSGQTPLGWVNNSQINGNNNGIEFIWAYGDDGYMRVYRGGTLILTSTNTFAGDQNIYLATRENYNIHTLVPALVMEDTVYTGSPVTGFTLTAGDLNSSSELGEDSVATLDSVLSEGKRYILNQTWVETHVLPYLRENQQKAYFAVPKTSADWSSIGLHDDFDGVVRWEKVNDNTHKTGVTVGNSGNANFLNVNSMTDSYYDYALEWDGKDLHVIRCNVNSISTEPGVSFGGSFSTAITYSNYNTIRTGDLPLVLATKDNGGVGLSTSGMTIIDIPLGANDIVVSEDGNGTARFDGGLASTVTLQAGYTYKFMLNNATIESTDTLTFELTDGTSYTTGVTTVGSFGDYLYYVEFAVPTNVPPLNIIWNGSSAGAVSISGSTHVASITGITLEGPSANQTGTNVMDSGEHGWISLDEQLGAGERLVLDNAFFTDFLGEVAGTNNFFAIGLKGANWTNTKEVSSNGAASSGEFFKGNTYIVGGFSSGASNMTMWICANGSLGNNFYMNSTSLYAQTCAFLEISSDGNNIRAGMGRNNSTGNITQGDESTVTYSNWLAYKGQTGDQGYGISSLDVMISFWTYNGGDIDGDQIDWTGITEISIPTPPATNLTSWTKALDFSGSNEHGKQVSPNNSVNAIRMNGLGQTVAANSDSTKTVTNTSYGRPWATSVVFKTDRNSSNQHIWNQGEGAANGDDNIFLRTDSNGNLYFGWGREGSGYNECTIATSLSSSEWYGVYIGHKGTRLSGSDASAVNLADAFDIRVMSSSDAFNSVGVEKSVSGNWTQTGNRMDRSIAGDFTVGGRGSNRNFHGKVASMLVTTLRTSVTMPTDAEIKLMITDPTKWVQDYKEGELYRYGTSASESTFRTLATRTHAEYYATQVWLMGEGSYDSYSNGIRNQIYPTDQNYGKLQLNGLVSNDIETVSINGLT